MGFVSFGMSLILLNAADSKGIARAVMLTQRIGHKNFWTKEKRLSVCIETCNYLAVSKF
jgi:hypothetical protein